MKRIRLVGSAAHYIRGHKQAVAVLFFLGLGATALFALVKMRKPPARSKPQALPPLVTVQSVRAGDVGMVVHGYGTVGPKVRVEVVPQVSGKVVEIHPDFSSGGFVRAGEVLLKIDPRDYQLGVRQASAAVAEAEVRVETERAEAEVAQLEWTKLHGQAEPSSPLVFRLPQIKQAEAKLQGARAALERAELDLERTDLVLPVDVFIVDQTVDLGQFVATGQSVGTAYGTDVMEIAVPLEDRDLAWFDVGEGGIWGGSGSGLPEASTATVTAKLAGGVYLWAGRAARTAAKIDDTTRLISVVIEVSDPFDNKGGRPFLLPGTFVEVAIRGKVAADIVALPRAAVRGRNQVWVCRDNRLHIADVNIVRSDKDFVYISDGLNDGETIILSSIDTATDGMSVRTAAEDGRSPANEASKRSGGG